MLLSHLLPSGTHIMISAVKAPTGTGRTKGNADIGRAGDEVYVLVLRSLITCPVRRVLQMLNGSQRTSVQALTVCFEDFLDTVGAQVPVAQGWWHTVPGSTTTVQGRSPTSTTVYTLAGRHRRGVGAAGALCDARASACEHRLRGQGCRVERVKAGAALGYS